MKQNIYSVGQINKYIKNLFSQDFVLNKISIKGEVFNCKYHSSGHIYFTLKDETGVLKCVMFRSSRSGLQFQMKEGDCVIVSGRVDVYEPSGEYQLYANTIELDGAGNLYLRFEALKKELEEMGMFAAEYKQPIPKYAKRVGIVTARTGAAIQDIRNVATRRNPGVQLVLYPAQVQGDGAAETIVAGIEALDAAGVDVIIVGRGGGSIEDLWAFNEEIVARAIFECQTPIVSAVGHEVDWTIADFVADMRAPTPSAAAEICVFDRLTVIDALNKLQLRMNHILRRRIDFARNSLAYMARHIEQLSPQHKISDWMRRMADLSDKMERAMNAKLKDRKNRLRILVERLDGLSPLKKMDSGFAYVETENAKRINSVEQIDKGMNMKIHFRDGDVSATVNEVNKNHERR